MTIMQSNQNPDASDTTSVDRLVLARINAPYKRVIGAQVLAECLAKADMGDWPVHFAAFFTEVDPDLVFAFAATHGISKSELAQAYFSTKQKSGEGNPDLEAKLGSLAAAAS